MSILSTKTPELKLQLDGTSEELDTIEEWKIQEGYWESCDSFEITLITERFTPSQLWMRPVTLVLGGVPWMRARIEVVQSDDTQVTMNLSGRDYVSELVEGHVAPTFKITEKISLADAVLQAARPYGIDTILSNGDFPLRKIRSGAVATSSATVDFKAVKLKELQPKDHQSVYEFCNRLAARSGCTIQPHIDRQTLVLAVPAYSSQPIAQLRRLRDRATTGTNNIKSASATRDGTHWPSVIQILGGTTTDTGWVPPPTATKTPAGVETDGVKSTTAARVSRLRREYDVPKVAAIFNAALGRELAGKCVSGLRTGSEGPLDGLLYRMFRQEDHELSTPEQMAALGCRILGERLKNTLVYEATVPGFTDQTTGKYWAVDTIVTVRDEIADVDEPMWIQSVTRSFSRNQGALTRLSMIRPGVIRVGEDV